jgi:hypothetical protein
MGFREQMARDAETVLSLREFGVTGYWRPSSGGVKPVVVVVDYDDSARVYGDHEQMSEQAATLHCAKADVDGYTNQDVWTVDGQHYAVVSFRERGPWIQFELERMSRLHVGRGHRMER